MAEVLDEKEYLEYKQLETPTPVYKWLRTIPDIDRKKARFFSTGFGENPDLAPEIDVKETRARAWGYTALKNHIGESNADQVVKDAYIPVIDGKLNGMAMLAAAFNRDLDSFINTNVESYGEPNKQVFDSLCLYLSGMASNLLHEQPNTFVAEAAKQVLDLLPDTWATADKIWPNETEFRKLKKIYRDFFDVMYEGIELPDEVTGQKAVPIIQKVLANLGYDYEVVAQDKGVSTMSVNQVTKQVKIPANEIYEAARLKGLLGHEIRVHVEETQYGERQPLMLLGRGLRNTTKAGEGKGVNVEMVAYDYSTEFLQTRRFFDIARRHVSIGLARGLDGNSARDFKDVYQIINALDRLWELTHNTNPENPNVAIMKALDRTWELLTNRTLKGVVGKGAAYYKDKEYAEGRIIQGKLLARNPNLYPYLNLGHYDLANPEQVSILKRVGTLPVDLEIKLPKKQPN